VRNTRRSKVDTPHMPLPLVAPPPELHHFVKRESPPAARPPMSFGAAQLAEYEQQIFRFVVDDAVARCARPPAPHHHRSPRSPELHLRPHQIR
jgi:hypothetical protein